MNRRIRHAIVRSGLEVVAVLRRLGLTPAVGGRGVVFTLHHVRPAGPHENRPNAHLSVTPEFLAEAIATALRVGLVPIAIEDLPARLADSADQRRYVAFTLDDAYRDNILHAAPVFRRFGVPYTIYACSGFVERTRTMWWETAEALAARGEAIALDTSAGTERLPLASDADRCVAFARIATAIKTEDEDAAVARLDAAARAVGVDPTDIVDREVMSADEIAALTAADPLARFGAHTETHVNLTRVSDDRLAREIAVSVDAVERWTGRRPTSFNYPYGLAGSFGRREAAAVGAAGLQVAVTTRPGVLRCPGEVDFLTLPRVSLNGYYQQPRFVEALITGVPFRVRLS